MADYYPLLNRAIAGLAGKPESDRHAIYGRARDALERQLRGFEPSLGEDAILAELDSLEATISRIEGEQGNGVPGRESALPEAHQAHPPVADEPASITAPSPFKAIRPTVSDLPPPEPAPPVGSDATFNDQSNTENEKSLSASPELPDAPGRQAAVNDDAFTADKAFKADEADDPSAFQPMLRPRMPARRAGDADGKKKPLALFAGIAIVAMSVIGLIALTRRDNPDRMKSPPVITAPDSNPDASKTEGRLAATDAPAKPSDQADVGRPSAPIIPSPPRSAASVKPDDSKVPATSETRPTNQPAAVPLVNRAFMVLEVAGGTPNQFEGRATWSFAPDPAMKGQKVLRAAIDFQAGGLTIDFSIARNTDAGINASHTVMVIFDTKALDPVREMSAVEWRERESQIGTVLAGIVVPIQDNVFMIGLDKTDTGLARNLDLLRTQKWMVFEIRLTNGKRGAILVEKGSVGEKAVADALADWK